MHIGASTCAAGGAQWQIKCKLSVTITLIYSVLCLCSRLKSRKKKCLKEKQVPRYYLFYDKIWNMEAGSCLYKTDGRHTYTGAQEGMAFLIEGE